MPTAKSQSISIGLHIAALALLVLLTSRPFVAPPRLSVSARVVPIAPLRRIYLSRSEEHSGGSNRTPLPARRGEPPPKAHHTFIPPTHAEDPKLPMAITVAFDSPTIQVDATNIGDPFSPFRDGGLGSDGDNGIGNRDCCGGIGDRDGRKPGITGGGRRHNATAPQLLYKVDPEFSEEARKAKFSGVVVLAIEVDANGRATAFRVIQGPGLGLEEKAIDAVKQWRFRPGLQDGKPVSTSAIIQVNFRLL